MASIYEYTVTDKTTGNIILKNATPTEVSKAIGIKVVNVSGYTIGGLAFKRRYVLSRIEKEKSAEKNFTLWEREWMEDWDKVRTSINPEAEE